MARLRSSIISKYKKAVDKAREALAAPITITYTDDTQETTTVTWDPFNKEPLDPNDAPVDNQFMHNTSTVVINASTSWVGVSNAFIPVQLTAGELSVNDVFISCKLEDVLLDPTDTAGPTYFDKAIKIEIDGTLVKPKTTPIKYGLGGDRYSCALIATVDVSLS